MVRRVLPASPDTAYGEWLDPEALADWMCPWPARCLAIKLEPWVDGNLRLDIEDSGVEFFVVGRFQSLNQPRGLSFTWHCSTWPEPATESVVTVSLDPHGPGQTLMTIEHTLLPLPQVAQHQQGWAAIAEQLEAALKRRSTDS
jgi:uncharacterized protein YndB with AHSA1/START domain